MDRIVVITMIPLRFRRGWQPMFSSASIVIGPGHPTAKADVVAPRNAPVPRKFKYLIALCSSSWSGGSAPVHIALSRRVRRAEGCQKTRIELTHLGFDKASA